jgi:hypothetical protein
MLGHARSQPVRVDHRSLRHAACNEPRRLPGAPAMTPRDSAYVADLVEAQAFADLYAAAPPALAAEFGLRVAAVSDATVLLASKLPTPMFNRALGLGFVVPATEATLEAIRAMYRSAGIDAWWLHWNPYAKPDGFPQHLRQLGFAEPRRRSWAKMLRRADPAPAIPTDLEIRPVDSDSDARATSTVIAQVFEMPPTLADWISRLHGRRGWRMYALRSNGAVVGGGAMYIDEDRAWLGLGAVLPTHRRRGGQGALMSRRVADAIELGAIHIVTETGEAIGDEANPSLANMHRCGFEHVASRLNFAAPPGQ